MVTPVQQIRSRRVAQQKSILEHLSPTTTDNNIIINDDEVAAGEKNNDGKRSRTRQQRETTTTATAAAAVNSSADDDEEALTTMQSHPRLVRIMEEANYEAYVDPYRGIVPFFSVSFNNNNQNNEANYLGGSCGGRGGGEAIIDMQSPWIQCAPVLQQQTQGDAFSWKFERGEDIGDANKMTSNEKKKKLQHHRQRNMSKRRKKHEEEEVEIVNVDVDDESSSVIVAMPQNITSGNNSSDNDGDESNKVRVVQCGCPTIDSWAIDHWEKYQQHLSKMKRKNKKSNNKNSKGGSGKETKKRKGDADVDDISDRSCDDDDGDDNECNHPKTPILICGTREFSGGECCPCDFNPFCLASLGGILDQYRYNVAKIRYLLASGSISDLLSDDDDNSDVDKWTLQTQESMGECDNKSSSLCTSTDFANLLRRHWSEIPSLGIDSGDSEKKKTADERSNDIRRSISVDSEKIRLHASNFVCDNEVEVDGYCEMIGTFQNELILASSNHESPATSSSDRNIQLSRPPGLRNLGATCYLNSQLQCLAQNLGFVHGLFTWTNVGAENSRMSKVLSNMQSILARMKYGPQSVICTNEFAAALSLENDEMQDPNEFARLLFDRMQESFRKSSDCRLENLLPSIFRGTSAYVTTCYKCNGRSERKETFMELSIPIVDVDIKSADGDDVDIQQCLNSYLEPELLVNENQYFCSTCMQKVDASRSLLLERMPPVLNIQLARYVFDMTTFSKKKLATKVKLPRTLDVPIKPPHDDNDTTSTAKYTLCAVQNHLGTSAHGGHYIADVLDWTTGVWYEFNDEDVSVLEEGPGSSFEPNSNAKGKGKKVSGSADAYNLFYVEQGYLSQQSNIELRRSLQRIKKNISHGIGNGSDDVLSSTDIQRVERYRCEKEHQKNSDLLKKRLAFRSKQIIDRIFCSNPNLLDDVVAQSASDKVWVDAAILRRFFSCKDGLEDIFRSATNHEIALDDCKLLCCHSGCHPKAVRNGKLLSRTLYDELNKILSDESALFAKVEGTNASIVRESMLSEIYSVESGSLICEPCGARYQNEGRKKLETFNALISLYEALMAGQNDLDIGSDLSQSDVFVISRPWVTLFRKCVEYNLNVMKGKKNDIKNIYFGGVDSLSLDDVGFEDSNEESTICKTKKESSERVKLDSRVNTAITCEHGKCHSMYKRRSVRLVPATVWSKILKVFPHAIAHSMESKMDECIGNCAACFREKQKEELFPLKLTEWRDQIKLPGTLRDLYTKGGNDEEVGSITPPEIEIFLNTCALSGDASNKLTCYIVQCREIQRWRDAYDSVVKAKRARKTNNFIRNQLNELLFTSPSDDSESREWNFRSLTCGDHKRSVGFPAPDNDAIRENVTELKEWLALLSAAKFGLLLEEEFRCFISSLSSLEKILHGNNSSTGLDQVTPTVSISIRDGVSKVDVQPSPCTDGCAVSLFGDEFLDNGIICKKIEEGKIAAPQAEVVPVDEDNGGPICKVFVHQIESGISVEVAASQIVLTLSSNEVEDAPNQGRRLRKRKARGSFPTHEIEMALDGNLAHFRLLLHQVSRESVCNQRLFMLPQALHDSSITELSHGSDEDTMLDLISKACGCCDTVAGEDQTVHIIMTYDEIDATKTNRGTGKRMTKEERDEEDAIIGILTEKACGGWKTADVADRGKKPGKRQERGFQGTFLQSSLSQNSDGERNIAADDSNEIMILDGDNETSFMLVDDEFKEDTELEGSYKLEAVKVSAIHQDESPRQQTPTESTPPLEKKRAASQAQAQAESVQNEALSLIEDFDGDFDGFANKCSTRELKRMRDIIDKNLEIREDTD